VPGIAEGPTLRGSRASWGCQWAALPSRRAKAAPRDHHRRPGQRRRADLCVGPSAARAVRPDPRGRRGTRAAARLDGRRNHRAVRRSPRPRARPPGVARWLDTGPEGACRHHPLVGETGRARATGIAEAESVRRRAAGTKRGSYLAERTAVNTGTVASADCARPAVTPERARFSRVP
jgi:hypothetical protein